MSSGMPSESRWEAYHCASTAPPWESGAPVSQFLSALDVRVADDQSAVSRAPTQSRAVLDVGCGSGVSTVYLASNDNSSLTRFGRIVGIDISANAIAKCNIRAGQLSKADSQLEFVCDDLFSACQRPGLQCAFDTVLDCQTFHAVRGAGGERALEAAAALSAFLAPGGRLLVIAGNASEPSRLERGPSMLTREQLVEPFTTSPSVAQLTGSNLPLRLLSLRETRFDPTPAYGDSPPLAWIAIFERPL